MAFNTVESFLYGDDAVFGEQFLDDYFRSGQVLDRSITNWNFAQSLGYGTTIDQADLGHWASGPADNDFNAALGDQQAESTQQHHQQGFSPVALGPYLQLLQQQQELQQYVPHHPFGLPPTAFDQQPPDADQDATSTAGSIQPGVDRIPCPAANCSLTFANRQGLRKHHNLKHTGHGRVNCTECSKSYADPKGLKRHRDGAHANNGTQDKYACPACKWKNVRQDFVVRHLKNKHPELVHSKEEVQAGKQVLCDGVVIERESAILARSKALAMPVPVDEYFHLDPYLESRLMI